MCHRQYAQPTKTRTPSPRLLFFLSSFTSEVSIQVVEKSLLKTQAFWHQSKTQIQNHLPFCLPTKTRATTIFQNTTDEDYCVVTTTLFCVIFQQLVLLYDGNLFTSDPFRCSTPIPPGLWRTRSSPDSCPGCKRYCRL